MLLQVSSELGSTTTIVGAITTIVTTALAFWQSRQKKIEEDARKASEALIEAKDGEIAFLRERVEQLEARNQHLEDDRAEAKLVLEAINEKLRSRTLPPALPPSPNPRSMAYSILMSEKKTRR